MIVFVVFDCSLHRFNTEAQRGFQFEDELLVDSPAHGVVVVGLCLWLVELVPRVLLEAFDVDSLLRISYEYLGDDVLSLRGQELGKSVVSIQNFLVQVRSLLVFKWQVSAQHSVQHHSTTPNV